MLKTKPVQIRLTEKDYKSLQKLANKQDKKVSEIIRELIKQVI